MDKVSRRDKALERRWRGLLAEQDRSSSSIQAFCAQRGVSASSFHFWKRELKRRDGERAVDRDPSCKLGGSSGSDGFVPLGIIAPASTATANAAIEIEVVGCVVRVRRGFDEETLARVVQVLGPIGGVPGVPGRTEADQC